MANDCVYWLLLIVSWGVTVCCLMDMYHHRHEWESWKEILDEDAK